MSFNNSTFNEGETLTPSGGTAKTLISLGGSVNSSQYYVSEDTVSLTRRKLKVNKTDAYVKSGAPNGYTQERGGATLVTPHILDNGNRTTNSVGFTFSFDPEMDQSERDAQVDNLISIIRANRELYRAGNVS